MSDQRADGKVTMTQQRERRAYRAPTLKYLGSVRELTLGTTQGKKFDGGGATRRR
jgi:hypothetical protein